MRTIRIFLASSEELENDRNAFGNLVRKLDKIYEKRGIRIELIEWEDCDAAYNDRRKQDEYNDQVRASDMFLALFHTKAGKYTIEEFNVATEEFRRTGKKPKNYVYCRDLQPGDEESAELKEFKKRLFDEMGHYWSRYNNRDSMQLHFVMQLQLVENSSIDDLKVERGEVRMGEMTVARMDNLQFAAGNEDYQRMSRRLAELPTLIEKARQRVDKYPDEEAFRDDLQQLLNERNALQDEFDQQQKFLFDTAKRIAQLSDDRITDRMRRAMEAFNRGDVRQANIILDEAERDAERNLQDYRQSKAITEQLRQNVISSIEEMLLKTSTLMADASIPIDDRIAQTKALYAQADTLAAEADYDKEKYAEMLLDYTVFLLKYSLYDEALTISLRQVAIVEELEDAESVDAAKSYNNIGLVYDAKDDYDRALEYHLKALAIREKVLGTEHSDTAASYNNIGCVYNGKGDYNRELEYHLKALAIREIVLGTEHCDTAASYNNIGNVYAHKGNYDRALEYYLKALAIREKVLGTEHNDTAMSYGNIGIVYCDNGNYDQALEYHLKALAILEKVCGIEHSDTAGSYNNIGLVYAVKGNYDQALEYHFKALAIRKKVLGTEHSDTAASYNNIGLVYYNKDDYNRALEYHFKALAIQEKVLVSEHKDTADSYYNIGNVYYDKDDYDRALEYHLKALAIREKVLGIEHSDTAKSYNNIGLVYYYKDDYNRALEYHLKALAISEKVFGTEHKYAAGSYGNIGLVYAAKGDYDRALEYHFKALAIQEKELGTKHSDTAQSYNNIASVYADKGDYDQALEYQIKAYNAIK